MASFSFVQPLHAIHSNPFRYSIQHTSRLKQSLSRRSHHLSDGRTGESGEQKGEERSEEGKTWWRLLVEMQRETGKLGTRIKESLSPRQKGDWKDLVLMSFSFAVYVYISQKIVCAYCAWMAMIK